MTYMICPIGSMTEFGTLEEAKAEALAHSRKYGQDVGGFSVLKVEEVGRFEHVSPIWIETSEATKSDKATWDDTESLMPQRKPPRIHGSANPDDDIPF